MEALRLYLRIVILGLGTFFFSSCLDNDGYSLGDIYRPEVVTVVPISETSFYFRLDAGKTFWPVNQTNYRAPEKETRVLLNYTILSDEIGGYDYGIRVNRIDAILTKQIAEDKGEKNDLIYGVDPVRIIGIWAGDNYLNVYFEAIWGGQVKHYVNLIAPDPEKPYSLEFRHNAYDDSKSYRAASMVAFDLSSLEVEEESVELEIKVIEFDKESTYKIEYTPNRPNRVNTLSFSEMVLSGISL